MEIPDLLIALLILQTGRAEDVQEKVGQSFNIFHRFGFLNLGMKVLLDHETEIINEPTNPVFNETFVSTEELSGVYEDEIHVHFCDSPMELFATYFKHFSIAGVSQAWKAFFTFPRLASPRPTMSNFRNEYMARRNLGIRSRHLQGDYKYAFARLYRRNKKFRLLNSTSTVNPVYRDLFQNLRTQSDYFNLVDQVGSHYIDALEIGDFIYQVFVFDNATYSYILSTLNTTYVVTKDAENFGKEYFNNWYVTYFGTLRAASGDTGLNWLLQQDEFKVRAFIFGDYYSIFKLGNENLRQKLGRHDTELMTGLSLKPISDVLHDEQKHSFENWLLNSMQLWENNL